MIPRPDLLDPRSPKSLEVYQLTCETAVPSAHIYMEAQVFMPDSKRLLLHRSADAHGGVRQSTTQRLYDDAEHRFLICDLENKGALIPATDELGAIAPSVSPDGKCFYYFVDQTTVGGGGRMILKRRQIDGTRPETIVVVDTALPGTKFHPSKLYPLSTISSDGQRVAISAYLGDGRDRGNYGLLVFDVRSASVSLIVHGPSWCNMHPQFSRSLDADESHDILIQENHGNYCEPKQGEIEILVSGLGADIHVIRDDGQNLRDMPWGRDGEEQCMGHQAWRGRSNWAITSTAKGSENQLVESRAVTGVDHNGLKTPGGVRNNLTRNCDNPAFNHFATDIEGRRFISDHGPYDRRGPIVLADLGKPGEEALRNATHLLCPRSSMEKQAHVHPFLSPDGSKAFFNSDESGLLQAYMICGLPAI
jgi:hypothetical protein